MSSSVTSFATTHVYEPLRSLRHIRLLVIDCCGTHAEPREPHYSLIQHELPSDGTRLNFEAASYTWGRPDRVSALQIHEGLGQIGLTANLNQAIPHMRDQSRTKRLWIDQLCINQADDDERSAQVSLMSEIYKRATGVIVWLGLSDESSGICKYVASVIYKQYEY